jgi:hypothetical protein
LWDDFGVVPADGPALPDVFPLYIGKFINYSFKIVPLNLTICQVNGSVTA